METQLVDRPVPRSVTICCILVVSKSTVRELNLFLITYTLMSILILNVFFSACYELHIFVGSRACAANHYVKAIEIIKE